MDKKIEKTLGNLERNNMKGYYCENTQEALELVKTLIPTGSTVTHGGSETLKEVGVIGLLNSGEYNYLDRSKCKTPEETEQLYRQSFSADVYVTSSNAVTENGELYNVDGNSNRVACIAYGPSSVVVIAGRNKIVENLDNAIERVKTVCAPLNTKRLNMETYCGHKGSCVSMNSENPFMSDGCSGSSRICCNYLVSAMQRKKDRIKVIIVNEDLGY
ncbi:MAG: lactate utilization protein [Clostridia bacterium]|nr:lactate utilization protein [Clostridia bacterium]